MKKSVGFQHILAVVLLGLSPSVFSETQSETGMAEGVLTLSATGSAQITLSARSDILAGSYSGGVSLATWQAEVTEGTLAFRLNPTIVQQYPTPTYLAGIAWNTTRTQYIEIEMTHNCGSTSLLEMWRVCPVGTTSASGSLLTVSGKTQNLVGGTYPVAVDAVVWTF